MSQVSCSRCGSTAEGLARPPLPGAAGDRVHAQTCRACWEEWLRVQVKLINERQLSPVNPEHYRALVGEMATFLNLDDE
jgi:Fe-S cluster biosynthesis and repair protein YggX